ncbi:MAG: serine/threonine protein kinase [Chloroflexi bacterium OLB15]|nr:MAG: serine/threonine protein kinase [Chloroflexi bacterium OLB15]
MSRLTKLTGITILLTLIGLALPASAQIQDQVDPGSFPSDPGIIHFGVGYYYQLQGDQERAIEEFSQSIELMPEWGNPYAARGDSYAELGEFELAISDYNMAIEIYPDFVSALYTRGRALHAIGEFELAIADYENAIGQWPEYALPHLGLGDIYYEQGEFSLALSSYERYLSYVGIYPNEDEVADEGIIAIVAELHDTVLAKSE